MMFARPSSRLRLHASRAELVAAVAIVASVTLTASAQAVSPQVRSACANDYFTHCSSNPPNSRETNRCMRAVGARLSKGCIAALADAGYVPKSRLSRRSASR
ncbi:hypothetical protein [Hyphomicrobium sp. D-2]|uniref:hypothetical protein n=1 Tax=Hyphomicrobium sp. D-2 TaxID=3041621 RepID=UPI0024548282|nr:hypothetical protein [Hyphomicrobium sp. D-2]MDH4981671.1 hypothetical protein [Hyphomicrobium sp. D-2]